MSPRAAQVANMGMHRPNVWMRDAVGVKHGQRERYNRLNTCMHMHTHRYVALCRFTCTHATYISLDTCRHALANECVCAAHVDACVYAHRLS